MKSGDVPAIETSGLVKQYGADRALDGLDLCVPQGSVFGFLGPNGAGKTTTLRILTGLAEASSGSVKVLGVDASDVRGRRTIGFLPDVPSFYPWMTAADWLRFTGGLFGLKGDDLRRRIPALLDLAGLDGVTTRIGGYSRGMRQRLGIAQALINAPQLLLLDEPMSALDPLGRKEVLDLVASLSGRATVFFSTHILADVERVCDSVAILDRGHVVADGPMKELRELYSSTRITLRVAGAVDTLAIALRNTDWVTSVETDDTGGVSLSVSDLAAAERAVPALVSSLGLGLRHFEAGEASLEEVFVDLVGEQPHLRAQET
jgi:ABC-2 type transport system ATP-binding protein